MSIYDKHNNFKESTLMRMTKKELVEYCLMLQQNLINKETTFNIHCKNVEKMLEGVDVNI